MDIKKIILSFYFLSSCMCAQTSTQAEAVQPDQQHIDWKQFEKTLDDASVPFQQALKTLGVGGVGIMLGILLMYGAAQPGAAICSNTNINSVYSPWRENNKETAVGQFLDKLFVGVDYSKEHSQKDIYHVSWPLLFFVFFPIACIITALVTKFLHSKMCAPAAVSQSRLWAMLMGLKGAGQLNDNTFKCLLAFLNNDQVMAGIQKILKQKNNGLGALIKNNAWWLWFVPAVMVFFLSMALGLGCMNIFWKRSRSACDTYEFVGSEETKQNWVYWSMASNVALQGCGVLIVMGTVLSALVLPWLIKKGGMWLEEANLSYQSRIQTFADHLEKNKKTLAPVELLFLEQIKKPLSETEARVISKFLNLCLAGK